MLKFSSGKIFQILMGSLFNCSLFWVISAQAVEAKQRILVIHSYHDQLPWTQGLRAGIDNGFQSQASEINIFHEFLDAKRLPELHHGQAFLDQLTLKYPEQSLDLIMVSDDPALALLLSHRGSYLSDVPIVYLGINAVTPDILNTPNTTGVFEIHDITETALGALHQTKSDGIIVINDSTETGQANLAGVNRLKNHLKPPQHIVLINDMTNLDVSKTLESYSKDWPILLLGQLRQGHSKGALLSFEDTAKLLRKKLDNPLYTVSTTFLGHGVVGGKVLDAEYHAHQAVSLAQQVLMDQHVADVRPIINAKTRWIFEYSELRRFGFNVNALPQGSKVMYRDLSFYQRYKHLVWITLGVFLVALIIIFLLLEVIRRRGVEEKLLRENEKRYRDLAECGSNLFWEINQDMVFTYLSGESVVVECQNSGLIGQSLKTIILNTSKVDFDWAAFLQIFQSHSPIQDFIFHYHAEPEAIRIFKLNGKPIFDSQNNFLGYRGTQREITREYKLVDTLAYQATYDWLTGLLNRYEFNERLWEIIQNCQQVDAQAVLCYIDLDQFKIVNDTAGHLVGDRLLVELSQIIQASIREADILSRLGGDEFGLILKACPLDMAQSICESIIDQLQAYRFQWQAHQFTVGCSIGMVPILKHSDNIVDLLSRADLACYKAKELGRGRLYIDTPGKLGIDSDQYMMTHIANLNQYIEEKRFFLVKQKIQPLSLTPHSGDHFEVLLRFQEKDNSIISPGQFIPAMEQYGVIGIMDRWVLSTVLTSIKQSANALISINISGISLSDEKFLDYTVNLLEQSRVPATCLCFEITETAAISHLAEAKTFIHTLRSLGAKFALDDFGSGFSSFSYLKTLPVDFLKIDGSLIKNIVQEPSDRAIVKLINDIAHMMGMKTIAEFVEDKQIIDCLKNIGVDYAQGYGISKPESFDM